MGLQSRLACAQVEPSQYRRVLAGTSQAGHMAWPL